MNRRRTIFRNFLLLDLAFMLSLLFLGLIQLRRIQAEEISIPIVSKLQSENVAHFARVVRQVNELASRMAPDEDQQQLLCALQIERESIAALPVDASHVNKQIDILSYVDSSLHRLEMLQEHLSRVIAIRDDCLDRYLDETRIEKKILGEEDLMFPVDQASPYTIHPLTQRHLNIVLSGVYATVDSFLTMGKYNIVKVAGHTDATGSEAHNRILSERRAQYLAGMIKRHLEERFDSTRPLLVEAVGRGEFDPLVRRNSESQGEYYQRNRRVELLFSYSRFGEQILTINRN